MASKAKADKEDAPVLDLNEAAVKKLITKAKKKGYVTYDEMNAALPGDMSSDQIEDIQTALSEMGVNIVENDESTRIGHDRSEDVGHDESITIGRNREENVGADETISIAANRKESVGGNETISIAGNRKESVGSN